MKVLHTAVQRPPFSRVVRCIYKGTVRYVIGRKQSIKPAVMITERSGPLPTPVHRTLLHVILWRFMQFIEKIAYRFPIHQVLGTHHRRTRHQVHGRAHHIKIITHTNHIGVGHISPDHRILKRYSLHFSLVPFQRHRLAPSRSRKCQGTCQRPSPYLILYHRSSSYILRYKTIILKTSNNRSTSTCRAYRLCR